MVRTKLRNTFLKDRSVWKIRKATTCNEIIVFHFCEKARDIATTQPAFTCSKLTIETLEQGVKYVQS